MFTLGIEGGPRDGQKLTVDGDGMPPHTVTLDGERYVRMPFGMDPWNADWHYCHRAARA